MGLEVVANDGHPDTVDVLRSHPPIANGAMERTQQHRDRYLKKQNRIKLAHTNPHTVALTPFCSAAAPYYQTSLLLAAAGRGQQQ